MPATRSSQLSSIMACYSSVDLHPILLTCLSMLTRFWRLDEPRYVVFDEVYYSMFSSYYLTHKFFFDQNPPLVKLLMAAAGFAVGYDGQNTVSRIGDEYPETVPVFYLRFIPAMFGALLPVIIYFIVRSLGYKNNTAFTAGLLIVLDNAMLVQSRSMMIDSGSLFFNSVAILGATNFTNVSKRSTSASWCWLSVTGLSLGLAVSCKHSALFSVLIVLCLLLRDSWELLDDWSVSKIVYSYVVRAVLLVVLPVFVYLSTLVLHVILLTHSGPHDSMFSSSFQATLVGGLASITEHQPSVVTYGSQVTLRQTHGSCWLHSHPDTYPVIYTDERGSSAQQQVTCYNYKDINNWWIVKHPYTPIGQGAVSPTAVNHGDVIQLVHGTTQKLLNSHNVAAAMSPQLHEVSCYIDYNISWPAQNLWSIEILNRDRDERVWKSISSHVRLIHLNYTRALKMSGRQLPDWGYNQFEVVTDSVLDQHTAVWNVEEHKYSGWPMENMTGDFVASKLSLWEKVLELVVKMIYHKETLDEHKYSCSVLDWLLMNVGVGYFLHPNDNRLVYFLGNALIWWTCSVCVLVHSVVLVVYVLRRQRKIYDLDDEQWKRFRRTSELFLAGWFINFVPYLFTDQTLFLFHYLPALTHGVPLIALTATHIDDVISHHSQSHSVYRAMVYLWLTMVVYVFVKFSIVSYGINVATAEHITDLSWTPSWEFPTHFT